LQQAVVVPTGFEALAFDSELAGFVLFEQVEGDPVERGLPLSLVASGANVHEVKLLPAALVLWTRQPPSGLPPGLGPAVRPVYREDSQGRRPFRRGAARLAGMETSEWLAVEAGRVSDPAKLRPMADALGLGHDKIATRPVFCRMPGRRKPVLPPLRTFRGTGGGYSNPYNLTYRGRG